MTSGISLRLSTDKLEIRAFISLSYPLNFNTLKRNTMYIRTIDFKPREDILEGERMWSDLEPAY